MPIDIMEFINPSFIRLKTRYTIAGIEDSKARFIDYGDYPRRYRHGDFPQAGYNTNHNSTRIERVNLRSDDITFKSR